MSLRSSNLEIILILLTKIIAFYIEMTIVKIRVPKLEIYIGIISSFNKWSRWGLVSYPLNISPYEHMEKVIIQQSYRNRFKTSRYRAWRCKAQSGAPRFSTINGKHYGKIKMKLGNLLCLPNRLAKLLSESFQIYKSRANSQLLVVYWRRHVQRA